MFSNFEENLKTNQLTFDFTKKTYSSKKNKHCFQFKTRKPSLGDKIYISTEIANQLRTDKLKSPEHDPDTALIVLSISEKYLKVYLSDVADSESDSENDCENEFDGCATVTSSKNMMKINVQKNNDFVYFTVKPSELMNEERVKLRFAIESVFKNRVHVMKSLLEGLEASGKSDLKLQNGDLTFNGQSISKLFCLSQVKMIEESTRIEELVSKKPVKTVIKRKFFRNKGRRTESPKVLERSFTTNSDVSSSDIEKVQGYEMKFYEVGDIVSIVGMNAEANLVEIGTPNFDHDIKEHIFKASYYPSQISPNSAVLYQQRFRGIMVQSNLLLRIDVGDVIRLDENEKLMILPREIAAIKPKIFKLTKSLPSLHFDGFWRITNQIKDNYSVFKYEIEAFENVPKVDINNNCINREKVKVIPNPVYDVGINSSIDHRNRIKLPIISEDDEEFYFEIENIINQFLKKDVLTPAFPSKTKRNENDIYLCRFINDENDDDGYDLYARVEIIEKRNEICDIKLIDQEQIDQVNQNQLFLLDPEMHPDKLKKVTEIVSFPNDNFHKENLQKFIESDAVFEITKNDDNEAEIIR